MPAKLHNSHTAGPLAGTLVAYGRCLPGILVFSLAEALGRALQLSSTGQQLPEVVLFVLEVLVWLARLGIVAVVLGEGNPLKALPALQSFSAASNKKTDWPRIKNRLLIDVALFVMVALALNALIGWLGAALFDHNQSVIFFMKNLTVIPFALVFAVQVYRFIVKP